MMANPNTSKTVSGSENLSTTSTDHYYTWEDQMHVGEFYEKEYYSPWTDYDKDYITWVLRNEFLKLLERNRWKELKHEMRNDKCPRPPLDLRPMVRHTIRIRGTFKGRGERSVSKGSGPYTIH